MASPADLKNRFSDFLASPRELLDFEVKQWLDMTEENHRGLLAKAMIAMENHGGGYILVGYKKGPPPSPDDVGRPADLSAYSTDALAGVLKRYSEPAFHADMVPVVHPETGLFFPVVLVPGKSKVPVRTCSQTPDGKTLLQNTYYIRRPGPSSEGIRTGQEWDELLRRCLTRQRDDMLAAFRAIMAGEPLGVTPPSKDQNALKKQFSEASRKRWEQLALQPPPKGGGRLTHGRYWFAGRIEGGIQKRPLSELRDIVSNLRRYTGWPPFWVPTKQEIAPYIQDDAIECWLGENREDDPGHSDFWRIAGDGTAYLMRGFQEDGLAREAQRQIPPGEVFDVSLPVWRIAEILLRYNELAAKLAQGNYRLDVSFGFEGLARRRLIVLSGTRWVFDNNIARQDTFSTEAMLSPDAIEKTLPETVDTMIRGLYELFDFFRLPGTLAREEIAKMVANRR